MVRILLFILLIILISCRSDFKKYEKRFDFPLMKQNEEYRLAGEYDSLIALNKNITGLLKIKNMKKERRFAMLIWRNSIFH